MNVNVRCRAIPTNPSRRRVTMARTDVNSSEDESNDEAEGRQSRPSATPSPAGLAVRSANTNLLTEAEPEDLVEASLAYAC